MVHPDPYHSQLGTIGSMGRGRCHIEMSSDGRFVAAGSGDGAVYVWDLDPDKGQGQGGQGQGTVSILRHHKEAVVAVCWNSEVSVLASADKGGCLTLWSLIG
jgi:WD40 repeat protein